MSQRQKHIIRELGLELNVSASHDHDYHAIAERLSSLARDRVPQIIDEVLTSSVPPGVFIRYDKIVLDCDVPTLEDLEAAIRDQLSDQLATLLEVKNQERQSLPIVAMEGKDDNSVNNPLGPAGWLLQFLRKGVLPWSAPQGMTVAELAYEITELLAQDPVFSQQLWHELYDHQASLKRLLVLFGSEMVARLFQARNLPQGEGTKRPWAIRVAELKELDIEEQVSWWKERFQQLPESAAFNRDGLLEQNTQAPGTETPRRRELLKRSSSTEEALHLQSVGLVLLHPFMTRFLQLHQVVKEQEVVHPDLAASLLHSLATGKAPAAEWELVLPKLLLGIPFEEVLTLPNLTKDHLRSGNELLRAAIDHWSVLGKTSVAGFRDNFLQREGLLYQQERAWLLQVEQAPYDMLLDRLPWNITMIKLPWMEGILKVEWS